MSDRLCVRETCCTDNPGADTTVACFDISACGCRVVMHPAHQSLAFDPTSTPTDADYPGETLAERDWRKAAEAWEETARLAAAEVSALRERLARVESERDAWRQAARDNGIEPFYTALAPQEPRR